jgi:hypothetical protein
MGQSSLSRILASSAFAALVLALAVEPDAASARDPEERLAPRPIALEHPIHVDSLVDGGHLQGEVWSVSPAPFDAVASELRRPETWCDIVTLHLNVKACVHELRGGEQRITMFIGYRTFQTPEQAHALEARLRVEASPTRMHATLTAERGPFGTSDHHLDLTAMPTGDGHTRLEFRFGQRYGWWAKNAMQIFLATWSRHRVGFTEPEPGRWVRGFEGLMERNVVRYHLALQAYLEHPHDGRDATHEARWARWFDLTERHPRQLHVVTREAYIETMRREHAERVRLQAELTGERVALAR